MLFLAQQKFSLKRRVEWNLMIFDLALSYVGFCAYRRAGSRGYPAAPGMTVRHGASVG
jgi:hypothetical protein